MIFFFLFLLAALTFWLSVTAMPDYSDYWELKGRKDFMEDLYNQSLEDRLKTITPPIVQCHCGCDCPEYPNCPLHE